MTIGSMAAIPVVGDLLKTALPLVGDIVKAVAPLIQPFADALAKKIGSEDVESPDTPIKFADTLQIEKLTINFKQ